MVVDMPQRPSLEYVPSSWGTLPTFDPPNANKTDIAGSSEVRCVTRARLIANSSGLLLSAWDGFCCLDRGYARYGCRCLGLPESCGNRTVRQDAVAELRRMNTRLILEREKTDEEIRGDISWLRRRAAEWKATDEEKRKEREKAGMEGWMKWAKDNEASILNLGSPLGKTKRIDARGISDTKNEITAYTIVQAESHEAAAELFAIPLDPRRHLEDPAGEKGRLIAGAGRRKRLLGSVTDATGQYRVS